MSEMIERVERAIAQCLNEPGQCSYRDIAHAAIEAMREPTDEMFATAAHYIGGADRVRKIWGAIIDAALQKAPQSR